jgi:ribosome biogenesis SPOUT family RNA methylase Rps3
MDSSNTKYYVVDHQEGFLLEWCRWEYAQMCEYLESSPSQVVITNSVTFEEYPQDEFKELNDKCVQDLKKDIQSKYNNKMSFIKQPIKDLFSNDRDYITLNGKNINHDRVCLLDMKAEKAISPEDAKEFDVFLFGGILGDIPSKDKTSILRKEGFKSRHLGELQMTTDTAILCTKLIVENGKSIAEIPYIDEPEFVKRKGKKIEESTCMEGFRYISDEIDYKSGEITKKDKPKPIGNPEIYEKLLFVELNQDFF